MTVTGFDISEALLNGTRPKSHPGVVYRVFAKDGHLLYVGMTSDPITRFKQHQRATHWWPLVDHSRTEYEWFSRYNRAATAEVRAIRAENPEMNKRR
jgi:predicted GIY-YIG superfamily endonuclease